ncbi:MAG TPA: GNVR domain-containing protein, partial [Pyrinomonadaceae bacterium]
IERQRAQVQGVRSVKLVAAEPGSGSVEASSDSQQDMLVAQLKSQLRANHLEVENLAQKEQKLRQEIELYQSRLNLTPVREQQLTSIQRDYDLIKAHYGELLKKQQESQLATDLEKRQEGQQFRLADPPNFPTLPSSPKRFKISVMGLFGGVVLGCALAFLIDFKYSPFLTEDHAARKLKLPLTVGIPLVLTTADVRARSSRRIVESCAAIATLLLIAYVEMYVYRCG